MADNPTSPEGSERGVTDPAASTWRRTVLGWATRFLLIPLIAMMVSAVVLSRIAEWWSGPKAYRVYVVGNFSGQDQTAESIWKGISKTFSGSASIEGIPVHLERVDDKGTTANAKELSERLATRRDTLMVIGHMSSSQSLVALPAYLQREPPIPVILPVETNPNLVPPKLVEDHLYYPVFRVSPSDKEQAITAAEFAFKKKAKAFWIIDDAGNPTYSKYLIGEFVTAVQERGSVAMLLSSNTAIPSLDMLTKFNIDCIFFTGQWSHALVVLQQVEALWPGSKRPTVMLTDSAVGQELLSRPLTNLDGVYITHPMPADQYQQEGYIGHGRDIGLILNDLLADTKLRFPEVMRRRGWAVYWGKWLLNMHPVTDARHVLRFVMETAAIWDNRRFHGDLGEYVFNKEGLRENARFHIWHLAKAKSGKNRYVFEEVEEAELGSHR